MELAIRRFDFSGLQDFAAPPPPIEIAIDHTLPEAEELTPPPPLSFSEEELEAAKNAAFTKGKQEGIAEEAARKDSEQEAQNKMANSCTTQLLSQVQNMHGEWKAFKTLQTQELGSLLLMMVRKVAGDALAHAPAGAVEQMIDDCLGVLQSEPKIIAQVHPSIFAMIENKLRKIAQDQHLENVITLKSNPNLEPAEAKLDWGTGSAERDMQSIWAQIEKMIHEIDFSQLAGMEIGAHKEVAASDQDDVTNEDKRLQGEQDV